MSMQRQLFLTDAPPVADSKSVERVAGGTMVLSDRQFVTHKGAVTTSHEALRDWREEGAAPKETTNEGAQTALKRVVHRETEVPMDHGLLDRKD